MKKNKLQVKNLHVEIENEKILEGVNLTIPRGETHILFGPNGCGKSTLLLTIMGYPKYKVTKGKIIFKGKNIVKMPLNERAKLGIGVMYQHPPAVKGVALKKMLNIISDNKLKKKDIDDLSLANYLDRDLNFGFSGGEMKKSEIIQLIHQNPELVLLDEPESGVDIENLKIIGNKAKHLMEKSLNYKIKNRTKMGLIITHTGYILDYIEADKAYVMVDGRISCHGNPHEIFDEIQTNGFKGCIECQKSE
ncbi:MAG: ABC transporter ATP-binding protein [Candidatus Mcinerneyibacterium aminivorans]|uniref:ABC transporter ATP-binding protein n=1 Tax=Candidatus Mcinerneyibacterium aminivorans TaxID=2703815 RepID=A0A5D0MG09_9BACT|nr:MAG: ABC transporter ATP-binding protein [Candidatus Mcinerneyibacterium aminivorans]